MLLNNQWVNKEIKEEVLKQENKNTMFQNPQDTGKPVLRRKFVAIQAYLKKQGKSQTN